MLDTLAKYVASGHRLLYYREYSFWPMWAALTFPHRPTAQELRLYAKLFGEHAIGERAILILGATPELRDFAAEFRMKPFVVDISRKMLSGMLRFCRVARKENEAWIHSDWLTAELPDKSFDIVAGDLSLRHLAPERQEKLLKKISQLLKPNGKFIIRQHIVNPLWRAKSYSEIFEATRRVPYEDKKYEAMGVLLSRLLDRSAENQLSNPKEIRDAFQEHLSSANPPFSYRLFLHEFFAKRLVHLQTLAAQTKNEIESKFLRDFTIQASYAAADYPESEFYPIYLLKR